jgi:hypothetical protein
MNHNQKLHKRAIQIIKKLNRAIQNDIEQGQVEGTIKKEINTADYASKIYSQIQGSIFLAVMIEDKKQISTMMDHIDHMIKSEMMI